MTPLQPAPGPTPGPDPGPATGDPVPPGARFWEDSYRKHDPGWFFGAEPSTLARRLIHFFRLLEIPPSGRRLLDLGCGEGRDSVFFASAGFEVEAFDGSPTGVARARRALADAGLHGTVAHGDLVRFAFDGDYDVIFANNALQFTGSEAPRLLEAIRRHTEPGGWNAIGMFTREAIKMQGRGDLYCLESKELLGIYREWKLLEYGESLIFSPRRDDYISVANLIARNLPAS